MADDQGYVLGQSERAARRLYIQDAHFADVSEKLLDEIALRPSDRVVELGCGPGGMSKRILHRLGPSGILLGVDTSDGLLRQASTYVADARFQPVRADISELGSWLDGADVILARTVLHHVSMVEFLLGKLRARLRPGTRVGFLEPDFRIPLTRLAYLETTRPELAPLRMWSIAINQLYQLNRLSPDIGATLAASLELGGYHNVRGGWLEARSDDLMIENMLMFYDEVRDRLAALNIMSLAQTAEQQTLLRRLTPPLPAVWGMHWIVAQS